MATDIYKELSEISKNRYGIDIRFPIHDALAILSGEEYELIGTAINDIPVNPIDFSSVDITNELEIIESETKGADVKQAIHDALYKLWQLKTSPIQITTGLAGIDLSTPTRPETYRPDDYIYNLTSLASDGMTYVTDWARLAAFMLSTNLFSDVQVTEWEGRPSGIDVYVNDSKFFSLQYAPVLTPSGEANMYSAGVTRPDSLIGFGYPYDASSEALAECLAPDSAFRSNDKVLITCFDNAILFAKNSNGGISLTFGVGYDLFPVDPTQTSVLVDPSTKILTFTQQYAVSEYGGVGHSHSDRATSSVGALTALVSEGDCAVTIGGYALTSGYVSGPYADGIVDFGSRKLYVANSMLAIEI